MDREVSFADELLILVDHDGSEVGVMSKAECHQGEGRLHRAFSVFLVNSSSEILLTQRSSEKVLWPGYWSNSCCSHPRKGEDDFAAAVRRVDEELGMKAELQEIYEFEYKASYLDIGSEHELCKVFVGLSNSEVQPNRNEISDFKWMTADEIDDLISKGTEQITPWFKMEWNYLRQNHKGIF